MWLDSLPSVGGWTVGDTVEQPVTVDLNGGGGVMVIMNQALIKQPVYNMTGYAVNNTGFVEQGQILAAAAGAAGGGFPDPSKRPTCPL